MNKNPYIGITKVTTESEAANKIQMMGIEFVMDVRMIDFPTEQQRFLDDLQTFLNERRDGIEWLDTITVTDENDEVVASVPLDGGEGFVRNGYKVTGFERKE